MTSILDALRALTAPPKRSLTDLRRNLDPGDDVSWRGATYRVADVAVTVYSGKQVLLDMGGGETRWVPIVEVFQP